MKRSNSSVRLFTAAVGCLLAATGQSQSYTFVDLGAVPGASGAGTTPVEMNALGDCVGWSTVGSAPHAFLYTDGQGIVDLGNLPSNVSATAYCVNDLRAVFGELTWSAFQWTPTGGMSTLAPSSSLRTNAANNAGMVVGTLNPGTFTPRPFFYSPQQGVVQFAGAVWGNAYDVNESGSIVGDWGGSGGSVWSAAGGNQALPTLPGYPSNAPAAINDAGQVAGNAIPITGLSRWFRYTPGVGIVDIGMPGAWGGAVADMNDAGDMVGRHNTTIPQAYLYTDANGFQNLNALIAPGSGYTLRGAVAINDAGQILCSAHNSNLTPSYRAVRLDPISPAAWVEPVGAGCASAATAGTLSANRPVLGGTLDVTVTNGVPNSIGVSLASAGLPVQIPFGAGCPVFVDLGATLGTFVLLTDGGGGATTSLALPGSPSLAGITLTWQAALFETNPPFSLLLTNGLLMGLGD